MLLQNRNAVIYGGSGAIGGARRPSRRTPCPDCESHCLPRFREAIAASGTTPAGHTTIEQRWPLWLASRSATGPGLVEVEDSVDDVARGMHRTVYRGCLGAESGV